MYLINRAAPGLACVSDSVQPLSAQARGKRPLISQGSPQIKKANVSVNTTTAMEVSPRDQDTRGRPVNPVKPLVMKATRPRKQAAWVGRARCTAFGHGNRRLPRYVDGSRQVVRAEGNVKVARAEVCHGIDLTGHHTNLGSAHECAPGTCFNNHMGTQNFPLCEARPSLMLTGEQGLFAAGGVDRDVPLIECLGEVVVYHEFMRRSRHRFRPRGGEYRIRFQ